jgi:hypothetical protein
MRKWTHIAITVDQNSSHKYYVLAVEIGFFNQLIDAFVYW